MHFYKYLNFKRREKVGLALAVAALLAVALLELVLTPALEHARRLDRMLVSRQQALAEIHQLKAAYEDLQARAARQQALMARRRKGFSLFSYLDRTAGQTNVKESIAYMKPSSDPVKDTPYRVSRVEMKLQDVILAQLVQYLVRVETAPEAITLKRLSITQTGSEEKRLDAVLQFEIIVS